MPTLAELQSRTTTQKVQSKFKAKDEAIVLDRRGTLRPAHIVEQKLRVVLGKRPR